MPRRRASVCPLQRDQTVAEGLRLRDPVSPFSLTPRAVSRSILSAVPYMGRESLATVALALVLYHTAL